MRPQREPTLWASSGGWGPTIDLAIATHPHADHIGGMAGVIRSLPVRYYMDNGVPHTTQTYLELLRMSPC